MLSAQVIKSTTMCVTALGMTLDFAVPELQECRQATSIPTCLCGKTVSCVQDHCESDAEAAEGGQMAGLVAVLTSLDPKTRPAAKDTIQLPFFTVLKEVRA